MTRVGIRNKMRTLYQVDTEEYHHGWKGTIILHPGSQIAVIVMMMASYIRYSGV
jgi:hypothetical protein